ncbi:MAG: hypothetical protein AB7U63_12395 [Porticoccaceae bacterium]
MIFGAALLKSAASAIAGALAAGLAVGYVQGLRLDAVRADLRAANDRIAIIDAANAQCAADVLETRKAMQAIKQAAEARQKAATEAVAAAEAQAATFEQRAADLAKREPATADQCAAVDSFTADYIRGRR